MADELKKKGNAAFSSGNFEEGIKHFTDAIALAPENHVLYSNRSACYANLKKWPEALEDGKKTVELKPDWAKGYSRLGGAYYGVGDYKEAATAYQKGLDIDPSNEPLKSGLQDAEAAQKGPGENSMFGPSFLAKLAMNPETKELLHDTGFMSMLGAVRNNPAMLTTFMSDKRFAKALEVGLGFKFGFGEDGPGESMEADSHPPAPAARAEGSAAPAQAASKAAPVPEPEPMEVEEDANKAAAMKEKEAGNAAYKKRQFDEAIEHYDKAIELYDQDISFITNRAAVRFEQKDYDAAIKDCELAVERGREIRADFKMIAKAMTRHGNCLIKQGKLQEAVTVLGKALTEHRNADTLKLLNMAEKALKDKQEQEYVDLGKAEEEKNAGNDAFKGQDYPKAIEHYKEALKRGPPKVWPEAYKVYSNRAACYTKLGALPEGEKDADKCIELNPSFAKGYIRKAQVQFLMKEFEKALKTNEDGLTHDPDNQELKDGVVRCRQQINRFMAGMASEDEVKERQAKAMADPEIQNIMMDPVMQQVLKECQENPAAASKHFANPGIQAKLQKLMTAGIIRMA